MTAHALPAPVMGTRLVDPPPIGGFGREVNRRFIRIAANEGRITGLLFQQQLILTVYGVIRLYTDLVALTEDEKVKQETVTLAEKLLSDVRAQVEEGTLAQVEMTRANAQVFSTRQDLLGLDVSGPIKYYYLLLAMTAIVIVVNIRLQNSRIGRAWEAIREDEIAARAMGINTTHLKLLAFAMGASFGGLAGGMFSAIQGFISPESFVLVESIMVVSMVVLGGMGNIWGVIVGALLLSFVPEILRWTVEPLQAALFGRQLIEPEVIRMLIFGLALVLVMLFRPAGLLPSAVRKRELTQRAA